MFEAGASLKTRELLKKFGALSIEEKKFEMTKEESDRKVKGDIGQGENLMKSKKDSPKNVKSKAR